MTTPVGYFAGWRAMSGLGEMLMRLDQCIEKKNEKLFELEANQPCESRSRYLCKSWIFLNPRLRIQIGVSSEMCGTGCGLLQGAGGFNSCGRIDDLTAHRNAHISDQPSERSN
jgi:hypothetical protein